MITIEAFEAGQVAITDFHHAEHVELAWRYLEVVTGFENALQRFGAALFAFADRNGKAAIFDSELTRIWMHAIWVRYRTGESFADFAARCPELFDTSLLWRPAHSDL